MMAANYYPKSIYQAAKLLCALQNLKNPIQPLQLNHKNSVNYRCNRGYSVQKYY